MSQIPDIQNVNLIVVGRTGHGSSSLCNFLLKKKRFKATLFSFQVTTTMQEESMTYIHNNKEYTINIVDTPGYGLYDYERHFLALQRYIEISVNRNIPCYLVFVHRINGEIGDRDILRRIRNLEFAGSSLILSHVTENMNYNECMEYMRRVRLEEVFYSQYVDSIDSKQWLYQNQHRRRNVDISDMSEKNRRKL